MCAICDGATEDEVRQRLAECIEWFGWGVQGVEPGPQNWGWAYTVGLVERFGHPELVVASMLDFRAAGTLLNILGEEIQLGRRFRAGERTTVGHTGLSFVSLHPRQVRYEVFDMWFDHYRAFPEFLGQMAALQVLLPPDHFCVHTGPQPRLDQPDDELHRRADRTCPGKG